MKSKCARGRAAIAVALTAGMAAPSQLLACSVCYGEPDSPTSAGLTWAITVLGVIVVTVLAGVVGFFVHVGRKGSAKVPEGR